MTTDLSLFLDVGVMITENTVRHFYRVRAQGLPDLSSLFSILGSYLREGCKSARSSPMIRRREVPSVCTSVPGARFCLIEFIVSSSLTLYGAAANGGPTLPHHRVTRVRRDGEGWRKSVRRHGKGKGKENLRVANL